MDVNNSGDCWREGGTRGLNSNKKKCNIDYFFKKRESVRAKAFKKVFQGRKACTVM